MKPSRRLTVLLGFFIALCCAMPSHAFIFGPKGKDAAEKKTNIRRDRDEMLARLIAAKPGMRATLRKAAGYATFEKVSVNLLLLASANGYGLTVDNRQMISPRCARKRVPPTDY